MKRIVCLFRGHAKPTVIRAVYDVGIPGQSKITWLCPRCGRWFEQ